MDKLNEPAPASSSWVGKIAGLVFVVLALSGFLVLTLDYLDSHGASPSQRLQSLWEEDLKLLADHRKLPDAWNKIREIELIPATDTAREWARSLEVPIEVHSDGSHRLEVLLLSWSQDESDGAIVQYNLVDLKTNNMVWELGRTYYLKGTPPQ